MTPPASDAGAPAAATMRQGRWQFTRSPAARAASPSARRSPTSRGSPDAGRPGRATGRGLSATPVRGGGYRIPVRPRTALHGDLWPGDYSGSGNEAGNSPPGAAAPALLPNDSQWKGEPPCPARRPGKVTAAALRSQSNNARRSLAVRQLRSGNIRCQTSTMRLPGRGRPCELPCGMAGVSVARGEA